MNYQQDRTMISRAIPSIDDSIRYWKEEENRQKRQEEKPALEEILTETREQIDSRNYVAIKNELYEVKKQHMIAPLPQHALRTGIFFDEKKIEKTYEEIMNDLKIKLLGYYTMPSSGFRIQTVYAYVPTSIRMVSTTEQELGPNTLGVAIPGQNLIKILHTLYGSLKDAVIKHEVYHINNPLANEEQVRMATNTMDLSKYN